MYVEFTLINEWTSSSVVSAYIDFSPGVESGMLVKKSFDELGDKKESCQINVDWPCMGWMLR